MIIREGTSSDTKEIISVLKASLGESKLPKTEEIWQFKHFDNPFGKSLILLAEEDDKIVGVRAFMRWQWQMGNKVFSAYRAVDTATHPNYQGKGIFKNLTLRALEIAKENGDHFIFNTPNSQSLPGYIKMDWKKVNKLKVHLAPVNPINFIRSKKDHQYFIQKNRNESSFDELVRNFNAINASRPELFSVKSSEYLAWRYENNPLQKYDVRSDDDFYLATYIKKHKKFNELRIVEQIYIDKKGLKKLNDEIKLLTKNLNVHVITNSKKLPNILQLSGNLGPILTLRNLNFDKAMNDELLDLNNWNYTIGDLELF
ncbi:Acetyltransferase (GNAT) domain-containing protein [Gillisia sp. Hel1_33_143]|uniref:GNAT family N-acetyltransferase n=1 Tax=Gillisia sp. Hel1_33_143 TaxID=1336796 RepID=UPI00087DB175|nr:GNAT family N-acetyltransferase [Gillisia sp. Hel1_33_143]SDS79480.1 Acetyltransferase (GNAT) domain-containing protein [Gillisia sp. Hel1_33_143]